MGGVEGEVEGWLSGRKRITRMYGSTLKCITPPFISSFLHEFFFYIYKYICVVDIHIPF